MMSGSNWTALHRFLKRFINQLALNNYMKWYSFRKRKILQLNPIYHYFKPYNLSNIGFDFSCIYIFENSWQHQLLETKDYERAGKFFFKKILQDKDYLKRRMILSRKIAKKLIRFCHKKLNQDFNNTPNKELYNLLLDYHSIYQEFSLANVAPWVFLPDILSSYIIKKLKPITREDTLNVFTTLSTPNYVTYTRQEELSVLALAINIKENNIVNFEKTTEFNSLVKSYFWIPFDYNGPDIWDKKYYYNRIKELLSFDTKILKKQLKELSESQKNLATSQDNLIKKFSISKDLAYLLDSMKDLAIMQDEKKAVTTESHYYNQFLYKEFAKRTKSDLNDFYWLTDEEIKEVLLSSKNFKELTKERQKLSIAFLKNTKLKIFAGKEAKAWAKKNHIHLISEESQKDLTELKGITGSPGHVQGLVRVIEDINHITNFKEREILVTPATTPIFVPIMRKAKAIITNEGGITCHAAIVSRELGIPCIISTKIATKVLKDGDLIEVDAYNGVVKILKREK
jgi:phosphohistidine swiveling domain-containing protein